MEIKEILIFVIVVLVVAAVASTIFSSPDSAKQTQIKILNGDTIGDNATIYIKLTDGEKQSLGDKPLKVRILDSKGKEVYSKSIKTHVTGVGIVKIANITEGQYTLNVTFDGDENFTSSSVSKKVNIKTGYVEENLNATLASEIDSTVDTSDTTQTTSTPTTSYSTDYQTPQDTPSSSDDTSDSSDDGGYIDENGNEYTPTIDENGREVSPTT